MAIQRGQSLTRGSKSTKVTNQFGVVRSQASGFGEAFGSFAEAANKYTEFQIKIIDEQWKTDFKTKTNQYFSELDNKYLNSPNPDMASLKADITGYRDKIIDSAPKRFENLASGYIDQNSLDTFNRVKNYSNKITVKNLYDSRAIDMLSIQSNIQKNIKSLDDVFFDSIEAKEGSINTKEEAINLAVAKATPDISDLSEKLMLLKQIDPLRYGDLQEQEDLNSVFFNAEIQRVQALTSMYYDDVDFTNQESVIEADNKLDNYLNNYLNGDTFRAAENLSPNEYEDIIKSGLDRKKDIKNYNEDLIKQGVKKQKLKNFKYVNDLTAATKSLSNQDIETGGFIFGANTNPTRADIAEYFYNQDIDVSNTTVEKIFNNLQYKKRILSLEKESTESNIPLANLLNSPENKDLVDHYGGTAKIQEEILSKNLGPISVEQITTAVNTGLADPFLEEHLIAAKNAGILSESLAQFINQVDMNYLMNEFNTENRDETSRTWESTFQTWKFISDQGIINYNEIDSDTENLFTAALALDDGTRGPNSIIDRLIKDYKDNIEYQKNVDRKDASPIKPNVAEYFDKGEDGDFGKDIADGRLFFNGILETYMAEAEAIYAANRINIFTGEKGTGYYKGDPKFKKKMSETKAEIKPYLKGLTYNANEINQNIMERLNEVASPYTSKKDLDKMYQKIAVQEINKFMNKPGHGMTVYNTGSFGDTEFSKNAMESHHNLRKEDAINSGIAYTFEVLTDAYNDPSISAILENSLTINGESAPAPKTLEDVRRMMFDGAISFDYVEGEGKDAVYQLRLNFGNSDLYDANSYAVDDLFLSLQGKLFNPSEYIGTDTFENVKQKIIGEVINEMKPENREDINISGRIGLGIPLDDEIIEQFFNVEGFLGKIIRATDWLGFDVGSDKLFKDATFKGKNTFADMSTIERTAIETISTKINKSINDAAFKFVEKSEGTMNNNDLSDIDNAKILHKQIYSFDDSLKDVFKNVNVTNEDYIDARNSLSSIEYFRDGYNNYQKALLIDSVIYYKPDMKLLKKFTMSGDIKLIDKLFPSMNNYHKDIMRNSFGR